MKFRIFTILSLAAGFALSTACVEKELPIRTGDIITEISTGSASMTATTASLQGIVKDLSTSSSASYSVGFVYGTSSDPTANGSKKTGSIDEDGNVTASLSGLTPGTTYYYATFVTLQNKVSKYGEIKSFVATDSGIFTLDASSVSGVQATVNGQISGIGADLAVAGMGFLVSSSAENIANGMDIAVEPNEGSYSFMLDGLLPQHTYYYEAYLSVNGVLTVGEVKSFTTGIVEMEFVDMGTSVEWAKCNLGAGSPEECGALIGYGVLSELVFSERKSDYAGADIAGTEADVVTSCLISNSGADYSMPTAADFKELIARTEQSWVEVGGVAGVLFTATNGNTLFFPVTGIREGRGMVGEGIGSYWSGSINTTNDEYAQTLTFSADGEARMGFAKSGLGLAIRPVAHLKAHDGILIKNSLIQQGDLENNGNFRIEIYNEYGATAANPPINPNDVRGQFNMKVQFTVSGVPEGKSYKAHLTFADADWNPGNFSYNEDGNASCIVDGDGTYTIFFNTDTPIEGAVVFCIDIEGLGSEATENTFATVDLIDFDVPMKNASIKIDRSKLAQGDIEGNGNYRTEIYNEWSSTHDNPPINIDDVDFKETMRLVVTVSGIPEGKSYKAFTMFCDSSWGAAKWSFDERGENNGTAIIDHDGTYNIDLQSGPGKGAIVFCFDIIGLAADGFDGTVTLDGIIMDPDDSQTITPASGKILWGDIESNGRMRIEIYNEYGSTKSDPAIDPASIVFKKNMAVRFTITGIDGNLKEDAASEHWAGLEYSDPTWGVGYWSALTAGKYEANVTGDGTYTVWMETANAAQGALVYCVDIADLSKDLVDPSLVNITVDDILLDCNYELKSLNNDIVNFNNKDGNGVDGRIEIYNEYSTSGSEAPQFYNDKLSFSGLLLVEFEIRGISGNLVSGADGAYKAELCYADADWAPSYWGGASYGSAEVTGDGTYQVYTYLNGDCSGAVVWTVELYNLWKDLVDTEKVSVNVTKVVIPQQN